MAKSLKDILGYVSLTGSVNATVPDLPNPLPESFRSNVKKVVGNTGRYTRLAPARTPARLNIYNAGAKPVNMQSIGEFDVKCFSQFEEVTLDPTTMFALRNFDNYDLQDRAKDLVAYQVAEFRRRSDHLRNTIDMLALSKGSIWSDADGNLLSSSSGAVTTSTFGIPSGNLGVGLYQYINTFNGNSAYSTGWTGGTVSGGVTTQGSTTTANIPRQLLQMKTISTRQTGYESQIILYGKNIPDILSKNDYMQPYLAREESNFRPSWLKEGDIQPTYSMLGYKWFPAYQSFWNDQNGVAREIVSDDALIFLPAPSQTWWEHMEGQQAVPTNFNPVQTDLSGVNSDFKLIHGRGMYALQQLAQGRLGLTMYGFDNFSPVIKVPEVVYSLLAG